MSSAKASNRAVPIANNQNHGGGRGSTGGGGGGNKKRVKGSICGGFRLPANTSRRFQPAVKFMRRLGTKMAKGMRSMSMSMRKQRNSRKVSSASLVRSRSCADPIHDDTHRAEAIEDCIEFLNSSSSSSSLQRSNLVSSSTK